MLRLSASGRLLEVAGISAGSGAAELVPDRSSLMVDRSPKNSVLQSVPDRSGFLVDRSGRASSEKP